MRHQIWIIILLLQLAGTYTHAADRNDVFAEYLRTVCAKSKNYGRKVQVFGGSLSVKHESETAKQYWKEFLNLSIQSCGRCGAGYAMDSSQLVNLAADNGLEFHMGYNNVQEQIRYYASPDYDIYILWCSTDDYTRSLPIGSPDDYTNKDGFDPSRLKTQCGGLNYCIRILRQLNPHATIYIFGSLKYAQSIGGYEKKNDYVNLIGERFYDYIKAQKEVAERQGVRFLDQYDYPVMIRRNFPLFFLSDLFHLTDEGYAAIAPFQTKFLADESGFSPLTDGSYSIEGIPAIHDVAANTLYCNIADATTHIQVSQSCPVLIEDNGSYLPDISINHNDIQPRMLIERTSDGVIHTGILELITLPVISITTDESSLLKNVYQECSISIINADESSATNKVQQLNGNIKLRGQTAMLFDKKSFSVKFIDEKGDDKKVNVLGIRKDDKWILDAMYVDRSRMRNRLCFDLWNEVSNHLSDNMIRNGTDGRFVEVMMNGKYHGLYCLSDKINRKLLGLDTSSKTTATTTKIMGLLYKCERSDHPTHYMLPPESPLSMHTVEWADYTLEYPDDSPSEATWQPLADLFSFNAKIFDDPDYVKSHWKEWYYPDNAVDFPLFIMTVGACDNMMHNSYLAIKNLQKDRRVWMIPWDLDGTLGRDGLGNKIGSAVSQAFFTLRETQPFRTFFDSQEGDWFEIFSDRWNQLKLTTYRPEHIDSLARNYADRFVTSGAWRRERDLWSTDEHPLGITPYEEVDYLSGWYAYSYQYFDSLMQNSHTDIEPIHPEPQPPTTPDIYDLQGRKLPHPPHHGIYIRNGRKYLANQREDLEPNNSRLP